MRAGAAGLVDSHAHLDFEQFAGRLGEVTARADQAGVSNILTVATSHESALESLDIARRFPAVSAAAGIHPNYVAEKFSAFADLAALFESAPLVAVGETGLDFYRDYTPPEAQVAAFRAHLELALRRDLPVIIHVREAYDQVLAVIDSFDPPPRGVFHCFSGSADFAAEVLERGYFISIAGQVTFKKADELREVVAALPPGRLLVETDCPYLAPAPRRGKTNEPAYVRYTAEKIAELTGRPLDDVARTTSANAWRLFGIGETPRPAVAYGIGRNLYLNITNRCPNECPWCVRFRSPLLHGYRLVLESEPTVEQVLAAAGDIGGYDEVVFCGYGEPTLRLDIITKAGAHFRARGAKVRLDTNGLGSLLAGRDITAELAGAVDSVSVSLNSADAAEYERICKPTLAGSHAAAVDFIRRAKEVFGETTVTAVDLPGVDVERLRRLASQLGAAFRLRPYRPYG